ncbi:MAG: hypothetical protein U0736_12590 [Gemmataceae bacterium]
MNADLSTALLWVALMLAGVAATGHVHRHLGVLLASQGIVMSLSALTDALLVRHGLSPVIALLAGLAVAAALGLIHIPVLVRTGPGLLLLLTALGQVVLVELWISLPEFTGGSGGLILPVALSRFDIGAAAAVCVGAAAYAVWVVQAPRMAFEWPCLRSLGRQAGVFGVPVRPRYLAAFLVYGLLVGTTGLIATRHLGYLSVSSFGLSWSLTVVMVVLASRDYPVLSGVVFCSLYAGLRVLLRQSVHASTAWANLFELAFPLCLLLLSDPFPEGPTSEPAPPDVTDPEDHSYETPPFYDGTGVPQ